jgi:hypothetical protein
MRRLISAGVAPADAAEQAKAHQGEVVIEEISSLCRECDETINAILNAVNALDSLFVETMLRNEIAENGIISAWQEVFVPVLTKVGTEWEKSGKGIEICLPKFLSEYCANLQQRSLYRLMRDLFYLLLSVKNYTHLHSTHFQRL